MIPFISCDLETNNQLDPRRGPIWEIGFGVGPGRAYRERYNESKRTVYGRWLTSGRRVVFHNMVFDLDWLEYNKYTVPLPEDSMGAAHLLDPDFPLGLDF